MIVPTSPSAAFHLNVVRRSVASVVFTILAPSNRSLLQSYLPITISERADGLNSQGE